MFVVSLYTAFGCLQLLLNPLAEGVASAADTCRAAADRTKSYAVVRVDIGRPVNAISNTALPALGDPMTLTTLNEPGIELGGGIQWVMVDGVHRVACWVSQEALDDIEEGDPSQQERLSRFERYRPKLEQ